MNTIMLVGRLVSDPEIKETENGVKASYITLAVSRNFKNEEGIYETDFIPVALFNILAINTVELCPKGDLISVKGRIQSTQMASGYSIEIIAEKLTFLTSRKIEE